MNSRISIIGGNGFLGSKLKEVFKQSDINFASFDINNKNENDNYFDITSPDDCNKLNNSEIWINLAAVHRDDEPKELYDLVNVKGAKNLCHAADKFDVKTIIFTSSVAIYGFAPEGTDETGQANYFNDYGRTKYLAENIYINWYNKDPENRNLIIIRPTVIFGEGNRGNVYNLFKQIASKKFIMIGNGKNIKSMAYVDNVAEFIKFSLSFKKNLHIYNYIDKPDLDMNTLVKMTRKILFEKNNVGFRLPSFLGIFIGKLADYVSILIRKKIPISSIRVEKFMKTTSFNSSIKKTGFVAPISMKDALTKTISYEFLKK